MRELYVNKLLGRNEVIKALTLSDFTTWSSGAIINVVLTLFVITDISGATVTEAGISSMIYLSMSALLNVPLGKFMDSRPGLIDEAYLLALSSFIRGVGLIALGLSTQIWQLYLLQAILGVGKSLNYTSWRTLFTKFLNKDHLSEQWGAYDTVMSVGLGIAALLGGILGDVIDFSYIIIIAGILCLVGAVFPITVLPRIRKRAIV